MNKKKEKGSNLIVPEVNLIDNDHHWSSPSGKEEEEEEEEEEECPAIIQSTI
ncbi:hypothetical protein KF913_23240 [Candidatus Obscuribacterales bacterium]|nr:hypothetical protein [Candidatus Obscuribacterales bacterium]